MYLTFFTQFIIPMLLLAGVGFAFGALIALLAKVLYVKEDTRVSTLTTLLPGYNCGACGFPGCNGLADAIINQNAPVEKCKPIRPNQIEAIREFLKEQENATNSE